MSLAAALLGAAVLTGLVAGGGERLDAAQTPSLAAPGPVVFPGAARAGEAVTYEARSGAGVLSLRAGEIRLARPDGDLRLRHVGAGAGATITGTERLAGVVNDMRGADPATWRTGLPTYGAVVSRALYPGIDARHRPSASGDSTWVASTYDVSPGANPSSIRWTLPGASASIAAATGELVIRPGGDPGAMRLAAPAAWQMNGGERVRVLASYRVEASGVIGIALGPYDRERPLAVAVAPAAGVDAAAVPRLTSSTFLGGSSWDEANDAKLDRAGNAYLAGMTLSDDFPLEGARRSRFGEVTDAFVTKLAPDGELVYSSYLGGEETDAAHGLAVDRDGNAYVTGRTRSSDFPTRRALQRTLRGRGCQEVRCHDAFVTKLDPRGRLVYSTYLGGSRDDEGVGIAVDRQGRAYVSGNTASTNYPTRRAVQRRHASRPCAGDSPCPWDTFVTRLSADGRSLGYSTYLGGRRSDLSGGIAVDRSGGAVVTGSTRSSHFPVRGALQSRISGRACGPPPGVPCPDLFVTRLSPSGRSVVFSTYLGGRETERAGGVAVDRAGRAHVTGSTSSPDRPTARPLQAAIDNASCSPEEPPKELCADAFVARLAGDGRRLEFSTYLGGNGEDAGRAIAVARSGAVLVAGSTDSRTFPVAEAPQPALAGAVDAFVARLAGDGRSLEFSTYLGGTESERANGLSVSPTGEVLVGGRTTSPDFPTAEAIQPEIAGDIDAFATRMR